MPTRSLLNRMRYQLIYLLAIYGENYIFEKVGLIFSFPMLVFRVYFIFTANFSTFLNQF